jgi:anti-sigma B factor antagonist
MLFYPTLRRTARGECSILVRMPVESKQLESGVAVITISGRLSLGGETEKLEAALTKLLAAERKVVVLDIGALDYVDSSGVGMLVSCLTRLKKAGGEMKVAGASPRIRRIFSMTGVEGMMSLYDDVAAATA